MRKGMVGNGKEVDKEKKQEEGKYSYIVLPDIFDLKFL